MTQTPSTPAIPEARRDGYGAQVAADPDTGIITAEQLTKAAGQQNKPGCRGGVPGPQGHRGRRRIAKSGRPRRTIDRATNAAGLGYLSSASRSATIFAMVVSPGSTTGWTTAPGIAFGFCFTYGG